MAVVEIVEAMEDAHFEDAQALRAEMQAWDVREIERAGWDPAGIVDLHYAEPIRSLGRGDDAASLLLIAYVDGQPAGLGGYRAVDGVCELRAIYVRPVYRGLGIGGSLVGRLLDDAARTCRVAVLDTAVFMTDAIALYERLGFSRRGPFHHVPDDLLAASVFMERALVPPAGDA